MEQKIRNLDTICINIHVLISGCIIIQKKSQPFDWDLGASGWAWIQEDEIVRNL